MRAEIASQGFDQEPHTLQFAPDLPDLGASLGDFGAKADLNLGDPLTDLVVSLPALPAQRITLLAQLVGLLA